MKKVDRLESLKFRANPFDQRRITPLRKVEPLELMATTLKALIQMLDKDLNLSSKIFNSPTSWCSFFIESSVESL